MPEVVVKACDGSCGHGRRHVHLPNYWNARYGAEAGLPDGQALVQVPARDCVDGSPSLAAIQKRLPGYQKALAEVVK